MNGGEKYEDFLEELILKIKGAGLSPHGEPAIRRPGNWVKIASGHSYVWYAAGFPKDDSKVELAISKDEEWSNAAFDRLYALKPKIEQAVGRDLAWCRKSDMNRSLIISYSGIPFSAHDRHEELKVWMVKTLAKFQEGFGPYIGDAVT